MPDSKQLIYELAQEMGEDTDNIGEKNFFERVKDSFTKK